MYIRNPEGFMDPSGGRQLGQGLVNNLFIGLGIESGLASRFMLDPIIRRREKAIRSGKIEAQVSKGTRLDILRKTNAFEDARYQTIPQRTSKYSYLEPAVGSSWRKSAANLEMGNIAKEADQYQRRLLARADTRGLRATKKLFRGVGLGSLAAFGFDIALSMTKPGISQLAKDREEDFYVNPYVDSAEAYTQRQRALQAVRDSQSTLMNVIGNEATHFHR